MLRSDQNLTWSWKHVRLISVIGFAIAAWGAFKEYSWWETPALLSGIVGLIAVVPFVVGQSQLDIGFGDLGVQINLWIHILGSAAVIAIVLVPAAHDWIARRLCTQPLAPDRQHPASAAKQSSS